MKQKATSAYLFKSNARITKVEEKEGKIMQH
jgi:hypothetical protein